MTAEAPAGLSADITGLPAWTLDEGQLGDLELLLNGAFAPLTGYMSGADVASVIERGTLADGTPWPTPVTLDVPAAALPPGAGQVLLKRRKLTDLGGHADWADEALKRGPRPGAGGIRATQTTVGGRRVDEGAQTASAAARTAGSGPPGPVG